MTSSVIAPRSFTPNAFNASMTLVGGLAGDVGGDLITRRVESAVAVHHQVRHARIALQSLDHCIAQLPRCNDA